MLASVVHATELAEAVASRPVSFFDLWREVHRSHMAWADARALAPLVAELGVALVERAVLDGLCRLLAEPLHRVLSQNRLGLKLGEIYTDLQGHDLRTLLPESPLESCFVRHTIGLGDALSVGELVAEDRVNDGLPQDLETSIRAYGLRYFKIKLSGMPERDLPRLTDLAHILDRETGGQFLDQPQLAPR